MSPVDNASTVHILGAIMYVRKVKLSASVFLCQCAKNSTAKYPINRAVCKSLTIPGSLIDENHEKLFS